MGNRLDTSRRAAWFSLTTAVIAACGTIIAAYISYTSMREVLALTPTTIPTFTSTPLPTNTPRPTITPKVTLSASIGVEDLYAQVSQLRIDIEQLQSKSTVSQLESKIDNLGTRLGTIEEVILENPAKALQSVSLKNDLENLNSEIESAKGEIDRMSTLYLGILGLIFALAASNIFSSISLRRQKKDPEGVTLSELKEQIKQLNSQIEKLAQQNSKKQNARPE